MIKLALLSCVCMVYVIGCAGIQPPDTDEILRHPLGTESVKLGMTKAEVESKWGKPDEVRMIEDPKRWKDPREEWVYRPNIGSSIPVDAGFLSKTKRLCFDGNNLTDISD